MNGFVFEFSDWFVQIGNHMTVMVYVNRVLRFFWVYFLQLSNVHISLEEVHQGAYHQSQVNNWLE